MSPRYTLIVGTQNWSSWSLRPFVALKAAEVAFALDVIALRQPASKEAIRARSPSGKVPALTIVQDGESHTVWDSLAICETVAERHPEAGLWPADPWMRAQARAVSAEMHAGFAQVRDQLNMDFIRRLPLPELRDDTKAEIARIMALWENALAAGGEFLFGRLGVADCMYAPVVSRFVTYGVETSPAIAAYIARVMALPAMRQWGEAAQKEVDAGIA